jgi:uncharacterized protein YjbJ (UPF0337 family)
MEGSAGCPTENVCSRIGRVGQGTHTDQVIGRQAAVKIERTVKIDELFCASTFNRGHDMNKDQVEGTLKGVQGNVQEQAGKTVGSGTQQAKGLAKQAEARLQKAYGDVKAALKNSRHS